MLRFNKLFIALSDVLFSDVFQRRLFVGLFSVMGVLFVAAAAVVHSLWPLLFACMCVIMCIIPKDDEK